MRERREVWERERDTERENPRTMTERFLPESREKGLARPLLCFVSAATLALSRAPQAN
jgi:hypothetical protein